jgi:hypothetical protein
LGGWNQEERGKVGSDLKTGSGGYHGMYTPPSSIDQGTPGENRPFDVAVIMVRAGSNGKSEIG